MAAKREIRLRRCDVCRRHHLTSAKGIVDHKRACGRDPITAAFAILRGRLETQ